MKLRGYVPQRNPFKNFVCWLFGVGNLLKRLQLPDIYNALNIKADDICLDVGCSSGYMTFDMARCGKHATGIDILPVHGYFIPEHFRDSIKFLQVEDESIPLPDGTFDVVLLSEVLTSVPNQEMMILESRRILKSTGKVVVVFQSDRPQIRDIYRNKSIILQILRLFRLAPETYAHYTENLQRCFGTHKQRLPSREEYESMFNALGLRLQSTAFSPSKKVSNMFELLQFIAFCLGIRPYGHWMFLFYPFFWWINKIDAAKRGSGCIMVFKKENRT